MDEHDQALLTLLFTKPDSLGTREKVQQAADHVADCPLCREELDRFFKQLKPKKGKKEK